MSSVVVRGDMDVGGGGGGVWVCCVGVSGVGSWNAAMNLGCVINECGGASICFHGICDR